VDYGFDPIKLLDEMTGAAKQAGALALDFFRAGERTLADVQYKAGGSPVTEADLAVDGALEPILRRALPAAGFLSEERLDDKDRLNRPWVFVVDPIDGTRAFMRGDPRWAISVALTNEGQPALAVLHLPALDKTFVAARGRGATLNGVPIAVSDRTELSGARITGPAPLLERLRSAGVPFEETRRVPSLAYRIAKAACGAIDAGLAAANSYDWDLAAADLVLREAGGILCDLNGEAQVYNAIDLRHGALAAASARLIPAVVEALAALDPAPS
jgi:myo-inositol-1(or 4)-monophosphatase